MDELIKAIEEKLGRQVYVGRIPGTSGDSIWATVRASNGDMLQCPDTTKEGAVAQLYAWVMS